MTVSIWYLTAPYITTVSYLKSVVSVTPKSTPASQKWILPRWTITWLFPFRHFPVLYRWTTRWQLRYCPLSALQPVESRVASKTWKEDSLRYSRVTPRKVQECLLKRAPSTRPSSVWWEPPRPWSLAVTTPAPSSDISVFGSIILLLTS